MNLREQTISFVFAVVAAIVLPLGVANSMSSYFPWLKVWHLVAYSTLVVIIATLTYIINPSIDIEKSKQ